ncbi:MAG: hypothetical protein QXY98_05045 [Thermoplasmata archaeon]
MKICPKCEAENLDFKIFCGECGASLSDSPISDGRLKNERQVRERREFSYRRVFARSIKSSPVIGIIMMMLPLPFTYYSIDLIISLSWQGLVSPGLIYGAWLMLVIEIMFLFGCLLFNREYRFAHVEPPVRGILVFLLTFSIAPYLILAITSQIGHFGMEYSALIFLGILAFFSWLLFFGWLGESRPEKSLSKKTA